MLYFFAIPLRPYKERQSNIQTFICHGWLQHLFLYFQWTHLIEKVLALMTKLQTNFQSHFHQIFHPWNFKKISHDQSGMKLIILIVTHRTNKTNVVFKFCVRKCLELAINGHDLEYLHMCVFEHIFFEVRLFAETEVFWSLESSGIQKILCKAVSKAFRSSKIGSNAAINDEYCH